MPQDNDPKLPLTATLGERADKPAQKPVQQPRQHQVQSEPTWPRSPARPPRPNRISLPHTRGKLVVLALGAEERGRVPVPDGRFMQIELRFGDSTVMIADEFPEMGVVSPLTVGGVYSTLSIHTDDVEALWERAAQAGADVLQPL